jgi:sugar (pentulose or hexulose) kinase
VLDVGKTNKKALLFDRDFRLVAEDRTTFEPGTRDGLETERTDGLMEWFQGALKNFSGDYDVRAIAVSAHGATVAILNEAGDLAYPVISYTSAKGAEVDDEFYATFGDSKSLLKSTCTANVGFANVAKILFYVKTRLPEVWETVRHAMFYDTFLSYLMCGNMGMDTTYAGNHTYLWDYAGETWSSVAVGLGADKLFPDRLNKTWDCLGTVKPEFAEAAGVSPDCKVTFGIHDSNANLLPYLSKGYPSFILNSTGTWCVAMSPSNRPYLTDEEVESNLFYNLDATGKPALTALFPGGMEYEKFTGFSEGKDQGDWDAVLRVLAAGNTFVVPGALPSAKVFRSATPKLVHGDKAWTMTELESGANSAATELGEEYFAALNIGLALESEEMFRRMGARPGTTIFIEGGFARNVPYCKLLACLCPDQTIALTSMKEGTALGAAVTAWVLADDITMEEVGRRVSIEMNPVMPCDCPELAAYAEAFREHLKS